MSELGDFLELLHGAGDDLGTACLTISEYRNLDLSQRAWERWAAEQGQAWTGGAMPAGRPPEYEARVRLWHSAPDRYRVERAVVSGPSAEPYTRVLDGSDEWYYAPSSGIYKNASGGTYVECGVLLDPRALLGAMRFAVVEPTERIGRSAIEARGTITASEHIPETLQELGVGADRYELAADTEHGVLLELRAVYEEAEMFRFTVAEAAFNDELDADLFRFEPPPDVPVVDADAIEPPVTLSLEEAASRASFTVLVPARAPARTQLHISYQAPQDLPRMVERVYLTYVFPSGAHSLVVVQASAAGAPREASADWASTSRAGQDLRHRDHGPQRDVELERAGTRVRISSDLELETLIELALSLEPAPSEPPRLVDG